MLFVNSLRFSTFILNHIFSLSIKKKTNKKKINTQTRQQLMTIQLKWNQQQFTPPIFYYAYCSWHWQCIFVMWMGPKNWTCCVNSAVTRMFMNQRVITWWNRLHSIKYWNVYTNEQVNESNVNTFVRWWKYKANCPFIITLSNK